MTKKPKVFYAGAAGVLVQPLWATGGALIAPDRIHIVTAVLWLSAGSFIAAVTGALMFALLSNDGQRKGEGHE